MNVPRKTLPGPVLESVKPAPLVSQAQNAIRKFHIALSKPDENIILGFRRFFYQQNIFPDPPAIDFHRIELLTGNEAFNQSPDVAVLVFNRLPFGFLIPVFSKQFFSKTDIIGEYLH